MEQSGTAEYPECFVCQNCMGEFAIWEREKQTWLWVDLGNTLHTETASPGSRTMKSLTFIAKIAGEIGGDVSNQVANMH